MFPHDDYVIEPLPSHINLHNHPHRHGDRQHHRHSNSDHHSNHDHSNRHIHNNSNNKELEVLRNSDGDMHFLDGVSDETQVKPGFHGNTKDHNLDYDSVNTSAVMDKNDINQSYHQNGEVNDLKSQQYLRNKVSESASKLEDMHDSATQGAQGQKHILYRRSALQLHHSGNYETSKGKHFCFICLSIHFFKID